MRNVVTALPAGLGMTLLVGGILGFVGGIFQVEDRRIEHLWPFNGVWEPAQIRFLGAIIASLGSGLLTFALLVRRRG